MDIYEHIGEQLVALDIRIGVSPAVQAIMPADTNPEEVRQNLEDDLLVAVASNLGPDFEWSLDGIKVEVHPRTRVVRPKEVETAELYAMMTPSPEEVEANRLAEKEREDKLDAEYGDREGWYLIDGTRHSARARGKGWREAVAKAVGDNKPIGDWEFITVTWIGEELPDVLV